MKRRTIKDLTPAQQAMWAMQQMCEPPRERKRKTNPASDRMYEDLSAAKEAIERAKRDT
jgi:hypothetical protein